MEESMNSENYCSLLKSDKTRKELGSTINEGRSKQDGTWTSMDSRLVKIIIITDKESNTRTVWKLYLDLVDIPDVGEVIEIRGKKAKVSSVTKYFSEGFTSVTGAYIYESTMYDVVCEDGFID